MGTYTITSVEQLKNHNITTRLMISEALNRGWEIKYTEAYPDEQDNGIAHCIKNNKIIYFDSDLTVLSPIYSYWASNNKALTHGLFTNSRIPTPETFIVSHEISDYKIDKYLSSMKCVVVKPLTTNHGTGITIGVDNPNDLRKAINFSAQYSRSGYILIQKRVIGQEYRFLVLKNKVIAVGYRRPPFVIGDGQSNIESLVEILNQDPRRSNGHKGAMTKICLEDVISANGRDFINLVPSNNEEIELLATSNLSRGGFSVDVTDIASTELKRIAIKAANSCFLGLAGVDIITSNIENGNSDDSYVIEVNSAPGLRMHEYPFMGRPRRVALEVFKTIENYAKPISMEPTHIGRSEKVKLPKIIDEKVFARIDTGATYSAIWASGIESENGLVVQFLGKNIIKTFSEYSQRIVQNSTGYTEKRFVIKMPIILKGRRINAKFTLADRSSQTYPALIGRNVLRNKFIVDVSIGADYYKHKEVAKRRLLERNFEEMDNL